MMHRSIKNGLSVLLHNQGFVPSQATKPLLAVVERLVLSDHVDGGGICSSAAAAAAMGMGSRRFFHAGGGGASREPMETKKERQIIINSSKLQRETSDDEISSAKVSLNQFPGLMAPQGCTFYETLSAFKRRIKARRLLRLNPCTGYFEEQKDVAAAAANHHSHDVLLQVPYVHDCRGSAYGWLFLTAADMKLLNPFSGAEILLPPAKTLPRYYSDKEEDRWSEWFVKKAVFSADPSAEPRPVVLVIYGRRDIPPRLAFCKPGDEGWTPLELFPSEFHYHQDAIYHKGQFYVLSYPGYVAAYDIGRRIDDDDHSVKTTLVATPHPPKYCAKVFDDSYLVVVDGELVRVELRQRCFRDCCIERTLKGIEIERTRDGEDSDVDDEDVVVSSACIAGRLRPTTYCIKIQRWHASEKLWVKVESLGDKAVFVGYNTSFALSASDYPAGVCLPDSIYFTDSGRGTDWMSYDNGIYNMKDESVIAAAVAAVFSSSVVSSGF